MRAPGCAVMAGVAILVTGTASPASADGLFTPFIGVTYGSEGNDSQMTYGAALGGYNALFGIELDFGYTPNFFAVDQLQGKNNVTALMVNLMFGPSLGGGGRIYAAGGAGLLRYNVGGPSDFFDISRNDFGINFGGGFMAFFGPTVGIRGDVRYFRNVEDLDFLDVTLGSFNFWRATGGLALRF